MPVGFAVAAVAGAQVINSAYQGRKNRKAAQSASAQENQWRNRALDYTIERDRLPNKYRDSALTRLNDIYSGGQGQQQLIDQAKASPLYNETMRLGENRVLSNASATGSLRSGNTVSSLANFSKGALLDSYNQQLAGIKGLAGLGNNTNSIANQMTGIGTSNTAAVMAQRRMSQEATQGAFNTIGQGINAYAAYKYSDIRAKENIKFKSIENGYCIYEWTWNEVGELLGLKGKGQGVLAHQVYDNKPEAIIINNGVLMVDYKKIGVSHGE